SGHFDCTFYQTLTRTYSDKISTWKNQILQCLQIFTARSPMVLWCRRRNPQMWKRPTPSLPRPMNAYPGQQESRGIGSACAPCFFPKLIRSEPDSDRME